jgi:S1-C subfamily serine protease
VVGANGQPVLDWSDLLSQVTFKNPGDEITLTIIRDGERQEITVNLAARPADFQDQ